MAGYRGWQPFQARDGLEKQVAFNFLRERKEQRGRLNNTVWMCFNFDFVYVMVKGWFLKSIGVTAEMHTLGNHTKHPDSSTASVIACDRHSPPGAGNQHRQRNRGVYASLCETSASISRQLQLIRHTRQIPAKKLTLDE